MKINVTLEEYFKKPLSNEDIKIISLRSKFEIYFMFIFGLSTSFIMGGISYFLLESYQMTSATIIASALPLLILSSALGEFIVKITKKECEFIIDKELLIEKNSNQAMEFIKESFVDLKSQFKSPKAMKLIKAIERTNRQPVKAELEMLNILERKFKEELYNKA